MTPLPQDVREALGLADAPVDWVRLRSSPGSIVGETFVVAAGERVRVVTRASALADLTEIALDGRPAFDATELDAAVVLSSGGSETRVAVGYLERDEVRGWFDRLEAPPRVEPAAAPAPSEATQAARGRLLAVLTTRLEPGPPSLDRVRRSLLDVLGKRNASRRATLTAKKRSRGPDADRLPLPVEAPPSSTTKRKKAAKVAAIKERREAARVEEGGTRWGSVIVGLVLVALAIVAAIFLTKK